MVVQGKPWMEEKGWWWREERNKNHARGIFVISGGSSVGKWTEVVI